MTNMSKLTKSAHRLERIAEGDDGIIGNAELEELAKMLNELDAPLNRVEIEEDETDPRYYNLNWEVSLDPEASPTDSVMGLSSGASFHIDSHRVSMIWHKNMKRFRRIREKKLDIESTFAKLKRWLDKHR